MGCWTTNEARDVLQHYCAYFSVERGSSDLQVCHLCGVGLTFSFSGTSIEVVGGLDEGHGNYTVRQVNCMHRRHSKLIISIDGALATMLKGSYPSFQAQATRKSRQLGSADPSLSCYQPR